ncbi:hypothetical protein GCM10027275_12250 [Rhabdobacter roseus]|uniref:Broad specificity phosphatase PhoE n=1 Tax=Rhabdobacter roseus TaxID=1655419 RepID=A0A840TII1_9BACT|nr:phosphoglycerate mutase family protein [Rhabdobacter roseus]MBB5283141.1 broad specificity phosphatase PhoE [Rhabdobacter roseus]
MKISSHFLRVGVLLVLWGTFTHCSTTTIYLVRHAEKAAAPAADPPLTEAGQQRARALADTLRGRGVGLIYSTNTLRTRSTAAPVADEVGVPIRPYSTDTLWEVAQLLKKVPQKTVLVVGHSNTLLPLLEQFPVKASLREIPDSDYDNLFVVTVRRRFLLPTRLSLRESTYGVLTP